MSLNITFLHESHHPRALFKSLDKILLLYCLLKPATIACKSKCIKANPTGIMLVSECSPKTRQT